MRKEKKKVRKKTPLFYLTDKQTVMAGEFYHVKYPNIIVRHLHNIREKKEKV